MKIRYFLLAIVFIAIWSFFWYVNNSTEKGKDDSEIPNEAKTEEYDVSIDKRFNLPENYTLKSYTVEKALDSACSKDEECATPAEYQIQSRCPFVTLCLENKCTVVCPSQK